MRRVTTGHIVFSPNRKAFVSLMTEGTLPFQAEEYADLMGNNGLSSFHLCFRISSNTLSMSISVIIKDPQIELLPKVKCCKIKYSLDQVNVQIILQ